MKSIRLLFFLFLIIVFLAGLYWIFNSNIKTTYDKYNGKITVEKMENQNSNCPDMLIKKGNALLLYNSSKPKDDTNPIPFANLDEYIYYLEAQRKLGNRCPVLYLQEETNAQGEDVYRVRPSPFDQQGGLPTITDINRKNPFPPLSISDTSQHYSSSQSAIHDINAASLSKQVPLNTGIVNVVDAGRENAPYNAGNYASFDPHGQYVGVLTDLDVIHHSTNKSNFSDNPMDPNWGGVEYTQSKIDTGKYQDNNVTKPILYQPKTAFMPIDNNGPMPKDII
jgi:cbb3-type cytochrome oxidase subunit 3